MSRVKAGQAYVEIGGDPRKLFATLASVQRQIGKMGSAFTNAGRRMASVGAAIAAPFGVAVNAGRRFEDVILAVRASTGATAAELDQVKTAALAMSQSLGVGPTEAAQGMLELLKAGMSLEQVLGGAGKAATQFAKVGGLAVADAAVVMADAMNVFKVSAGTAANTLSSAADASSTSIEGISLAFSQVSAVAGLANQSIEDTAASLAVLANAGVKGSDAGTSLKTMLMRLMAPADDAVGALQQLGLTTQSFRNADGTMRPMVEIIRTLTDAMAGMDQAAKDDIFRRIFGQDAIRAAAVLTTAGVAGFQTMQDGMAGAMSVGDKFGEMNRGLSGALATLFAALERLAIAVTDAVGPAFMDMAEMILPIISGITAFVQKNQELVATFAKAAVAAIAVGGAIMGIGLGFKVVAAAMALAMSPIGSIVAIVAASVVALGNLSDSFLGLAKTASITFRGIYDAIAIGDLSGAMDILWAGLQAGWLRGVEALMGAVDPWISMFQNAFTILGAEIFKVWDTIWVNVSNSFNTFGAYLRGAFDNLINGVMAAWDTLESGIRKSWNYVQSFFKRGFDLEKENNNVDSEMSARARQRELARPGFEGRTLQAAQENQRALRQRDDRARGVDANTDATVADRKARNAANAVARRAATQAVEDRLRELTEAQAQRRAAAEAELAAANVADAANRPRVAVDASAIQSAAAAATAGQSEVAGTFSSAALGSMGFGQSLQQKANELLGKIEQNTRMDPALAVQP